MQDMTDNDIKLITDALLDLVESDGRRKTHSEHALDIKIQRDHRRAGQFVRTQHQRHDHSLLRTECSEIMDSAALTTRQHQVLLDRIQGLTFEDIARKIHRSKQGVQHIFVQAVKKIVRAYRVYPYVGISEIYYRETHRGQVPRSSGRIAKRV